MTDHRASAPLRALTLRQPDATFAMLGIRPLLIRSSPAPHWAVQRRIVIHAGGWPLRDEELRYYVDVIYDGDMPGLARDAVPRFAALLAAYRHDRSAIPLGTALGTAWLGLPRSARLALIDDPNIDDVAPDRWVWPVTDPEPFNTPVKMTGERGFWRWPSDAERAERARQPTLAFPSQPRRRRHG